MRASLSLPFAGFPLWPPCPSRSFAIFMPFAGSLPLADFLPFTGSLPRNLPVTGFLPGNVLKYASPFRAFAPCSQTLYVVSFAGIANGLLLLLKSSSLFSGVSKLLSSNSPVSFERFAPCSQILKSLSSGSLLVLKCSSLFRAICCFVSKSLCLLLVLISSLFRAVCSLFSFFSPFPTEFSSFFRAVCALFSNSLVSFERPAPYSQILYTLLRALCSLFSKSLVPFEQFAPCSQIF